MQYILFKPLRISNLGGVMPQGVEIITCYGDWYVGKILDIKQLYTLSEFITIPIDEDTAIGFQLLDVDRLPLNTDDPESEETRPLTEEELLKKQKAQNLLKKLEIRSYIKLNNGDVEDIIADISKSLGLLVKYLYDNQIISQDIYDIFANYISLYDEATLKTKLKTRNDYIAQILQNYFKS